MYLPLYYWPKVVKQVVKCTSIAKGEGHAFHLVCGKGREEPGKCNRKTRSILICLPHIGNIPISHHHKAKTDVSF